MLTNQDIQRIKAFRELIVETMDMLVPGHRDRYEIIKDADLDLERIEHALVFIQNAKKKNESAQAAYDMADKIYVNRGKPEQRKTFKEGKEHIITLLDAHIENITNLRARLSNEDIDEQLFANIEKMCGYIGLFM